MTDQEISAILRRGFTAEQLEWKVQTSGRNDRGIWAQIVPYVSARAVIHRLEEAFGPLGFSIGFTPTDKLGSPAMMCRIQAGAVYREDVSEVSDIEPAKGAASGALKRAAVQFGIGAYLYDSPKFYAVVSEDMKAQLAYRGYWKPNAKKGETGPPVPYKWDLPQEAITWIDATLASAETGSSSPAPSQPGPASGASGTSTTASPPPSPRATTSAPAKPSSTSGVKMPGKEGMWSDHAGLPIEDVPDSVLETASDHYATKTSGKYGKLAAADLAIISAELQRRYGPPKSVSVPAKSAPAQDGDPGPQDPGDLDVPDDDELPPW